MFVVHDHSASLRLRSPVKRPSQPIQPCTLSATLHHPAPTHTRKCSAEYSPALAPLNPTTRLTNKPLNSARPSLHSLHSLHFVTLSFRNVGNAVQRQRTCIGAVLSASLRLPYPPDAQAQPTQLRPARPSPRPPGSDPHPQRLHSPQVVEEQHCWLSLRLCS